MTFTVDEICERLEKIRCISEGIDICGEIGKVYAQDVWSLLEEYRTLLLCLKVTV